MTPYRSIFGDINPLGIATDIAGFPVYRAYRL
jgi:hypothetical protein